MTTDGIYERLLQVIDAVSAMGEKAFHRKTVHKPHVLILEPTIINNEATFPVWFSWTFTRDSAFSGGRIRWARGKNIAQFMKCINREGESVGLSFLPDLLNLEFGVEGGSPQRGNMRSNELAMYVCFTVYAHPINATQKNEARP